MNGFDGHHRTAGGGAGWHAAVVGAGAAAWPLNAAQSPSLAALAEVARHRVLECLNLMSAEEAHVHLGDHVADVTAGERRSVFRLDVSYAGAKQTEVRLCATSGAFSWWLECHCGRRSSRRRLASAESPCKVASIASTPGIFSNNSSR